MNREFTPEKLGFMILESDFPGFSMKENPLGRLPSSDDIAAVLQKISPYLKIRLCPLGYFFDAEGNPMPSKEEERWGSTIDGEVGDYCWCGSLWETLAIAYLRIIKKI